MELLPISMVSMLPARVIQANEVTSLDTELGREVRRGQLPDTAGQRTGGRSNVTSTGLPRIPSPGQSEPSFLACIRHILPFLR